MELGFNPGPPPFYIRSPWWWSSNTAVAGGKILKKSWQNRSVWRRQQCVFFFKRLSPHRCRDGLFWLVGSREHKLAMPLCLQASSRSVAVLLQRLPCFTFKCSINHHVYLSWQFIQSKTLVGPCLLWCLWGQVVKKEREKHCRYTARN